MAECLSFSRVSNFFRLHSRLDELLETFGHRVVELLDKHWANLVHQGLNCFVLSKCFSKIMFLNKLKLQILSCPLKQYMWFNSKSILSCTNNSNLQVCIFEIGVD